MKTKKTKSSQWNLFCFKIHKKLFFPFLFSSFYFFVCVFRGCLEHVCLYFHISLIQQNPDEDWDYKSLSLNPNITWEIVQQNPDKQWDYKSLSKKSNITWEIVQQNPDKPWDYSILSINPNITWEIAKKT